MLMFLIILHCWVAYPAADNRLNLRIDVCLRSAYSSKKPFNCRLHALSSHSITLDPSQSRDAPTPDSRRQLWGPNSKNPDLTIQISFEIAV